jgi:hypothetical protein
MSWIVSSELLWKMMNGSREIRGVSEEELNLRKWADSSSIPICEWVDHTEQHDQICVDLCVSAFRLIGDAG